MMKYTIYSKEGYDIIRGATNLKAALKKVERLGYKAQEIVVIRSVYG
jgi:hypothetical protein